MPSHSARPRSDAHNGRGRAKTTAPLACSPTPLSSGQQLNEAIYPIALIRMNRDPATRDDVAKRTSQGRTKKEIIRSLKRYISCQIYRPLNEVSDDSKVLQPRPGSLKIAFAHLEPIARSQLPGVGQRRHRHSGRRDDSNLPLILVDDLTGIS